MYSSPFPLVHFSKEMILLYSKVFSIQYFDPMSAYDIVYGVVEQYFDLFLLQMVDRLATIFFFFETSGTGFF